MPRSRRTHRTSRHSVETLPLDLALSVRGGASAAYRILYASIDPARLAAVGTAAVFTENRSATGWLAGDRMRTAPFDSGDDCTSSANAQSTRQREYLSHWLDQGYAEMSPPTMSAWAPRADELPHRPDHRARHRRRG